MTLSITGRCARTGQLGVAVSSYSVGWTFFPAYRSVSQLSFLALATGGIGTVIGQANTPPRVTAKVLAYLDNGTDAQRALAAALGEETTDVREHCQVAVVDAAGRTAAFTGESPEEWRGHHAGEGYVAAGNILAGESVVQELADSFEANAHLSLDERLLAALERGVAAGGDKRGQRSGLLRVATATYATDLEIRVHDHADPIAELRRLLAVFHEESDFIGLAIEASNIIRAALPEAELTQRAEMTTYEAIGQLRALVADSDAPGEQIELLDRLLASLPEQPFVSEMRFGNAVSLLEANMKLAEKEQTQPAEERASGS